MTPVSDPQPSPQIVIHADNCDSDMLAAVVVALSGHATHAAPAPAENAWQVAARHEGQGDLRIVRPQQLSIRGNLQW